MYFFIEILYFIAFGVNYFSFCSHKLLFYRYDSVREHVLLQMLKIQVGEGMWVALSSKEQNERLLHLKVEEERLRKDDKLELASRFPGAKHGTGLSLLLLMDESLAEMEIRELKIKEKMKESGLYLHQFVIIIFKWIYVLEIIFDRGRS